MAHSVTSVVKFGGTSVANPQKVRRAAETVISRYLQRGEKVVVVVSAMAGMTDQLGRYIDEMKAGSSGERSLDEDLVLSSGESITTALLAMALTHQGYPARSFLGWQLPIVTDETVRRAHILQVTTGNLITCWDQGQIPVVAGFQGVTENGRITTLGRGGSDTTAVALASALQADCCDILTDVDGVYTADPRIVPAAKRLPFVEFDTMVEMARTGAKVLQARSVELAAKHKIRLRVLSSFAEGEGTLVGWKRRENVENCTITGLTQQKNLVKLVLSSGRSLNVLEQFWTLGEPFDVLTKDFFLAPGEESFLVESSSVGLFEACLNQLQESGVVEAFHFNYDIARVSMVGVGVGSRSSVLSTVVSEFETQNITLLGLAFSSMRVDVLVEKNMADLALLTLHTAFSDRFADE